MMFDVPVLLVAGLAISFITRTETAPCLSETISMDVTSSADVRSLTNAIDCTGVGVFNVTWYSSLQIEQRIEVSHLKSVIVTGFGFPTIRAGLNIDFDYDGDDAGAAIDRGSSTGIFSVYNGSNLTLKKMVLDGGDSEDGGAVAVTASSSLYVYDCSFTNNNASAGGAISASNSSELYIDGTTWFGNNSASLGGAIFVYNSTLHVDGSTSFDSNKAGIGGGIYSDESVVNINGNTFFLHNIADGFLKKTVTSTLTSSGAYYVIEKPYSTGGGMHSRSSEVHIDGVTNFSNSTATYGGAMYSEGSRIYMDGSTDFSNNMADMSGGAVHAYGSLVYMDGSGNLANNSASLGGGAVNVERAGFYVDGHVIFSDNHDDYIGGAIAAVLADVSVDGNTVFVRNSAIGNGGAIYGVGSDVRINGNTSFVRNSAASGGAIGLITGSNLNITGSKARSVALFGDEGDGGLLYSDVGSGPSSIGGVAFVENVASDKGGALYVANYDWVEAGNATFRSNEAEFGGAVFLTLAIGKLTGFTSCVFQGNDASDGGAVYLYTGTGVDSFTNCVFRDNFAKFSGGAIFHTGSMRLSDASFMANVVEADGPAIMSIGLLIELSNVSFLDNAYRCPAGQYGHILNINQSTLCTSCFDEVCARCTNKGEGVPNGAEVEVGGIPLCSTPSSGVTDLAKGTTLATLTLERGYYRTSNHSHEVNKCYNEDACVGGNDTEKYCASGYEGPYCAVCSQGFTPGVAYSCRKCSGGVRQSAIGLAVAVALVGLPLVALLFLHLGSVVNEEEELDQDDPNDWEVAHGGWKQRCWSYQSWAVEMLPVAEIKIVVTVWQIISQFAAITGDIYPEIYTEFVSKLNPINLDLDLVLSYSCIVANDFYDRLLFATITPPLVLFLLALSYCLGKKRNSSSESAMNVVRRKHQSVALYIAFLVYSPVSYKIFQAFSCDELDDGGTYLRADYSLSCLAPCHSWYEVYALIMVGVYPVGIPAVFAWLLGRHRRDLVKPDRDLMAHLQPLNGIWGAYRPSRYYYEVVECGRRIILTAIAAFVLPNSMAQIAIVFLVAFAFVFISESLSPFEREIDTILYRWGNGIIVGSVYIALLMKMEVGHDSIKAVSAFSAILIIANVAMAATVFFQTALLVNEWRRVNKVKKEAKLAQAQSPPRRTISSLYSRYLGRESEREIGS